MNRLIIVAFLTMILSFAAGYGLAHRKDKLLYESTSRTQFLHHELEMANATGIQLGI